MALAGVVALWLHLWHSPPAMAIGVVALAFLGVGLFKFVVSKLKKLFRLFIRKAIVMVLLLMMCLNMVGCAPILAGVIVVNAVEGLYALRDKMPVMRSRRESSNLELSEKEIEQKVDNYINLNSGLDKEVDLEPRGYLIEYGVTEEQLYEGYLRALNNPNFRISFYAARALAILGDPLAKEVLITGFKGKYDIEVFLPSWVSINSLNDNDKQEIEQYVSMQSAFSLAELKEPEVTNYLIGIISDFKNKPEMRAYAAYNLGKFQDARVVEALMKSASYPDEGVRAASIWALGEIGEPKAFDLFIAALKDKDIDVINEAVTALGKLGAPEAIPYIEDILKNIPGKKIEIGSPIVLRQRSREKEIKIRAIIALGQIGSSDTLSILIKYTKDVIPEVRCAAVSVLAQFDEPEVIQVLIDALNDPDASVRIQAVIGLSDRIDEDEKVRDAIVSLLKREKDDNVRLVCINSLGGVPQPEIRKTIADYLTDKDERMRQAAAISIIKYEDKEATIEQVMPLLNDPSPQVSSTVAVGLSEYIDDYPQLIDPINKFLKQGNLNIRMGILSGLGRSNNLKTVDIIRPYLQDANPSIRSTAILSLGQIGKPEAIPDISLKVTDTNWKVREATATSLGMLATKETLNPLRTLIKDEHPFVRRAAVPAFINVPEAPIIEIEPMLKDPSWQVRLTTAEVLSNSVLSSPKLVTPFVNLAKSDPHPLVRSTATLGLSGINQPEAINVIQQNLKSVDWALRRNSALAAGKIDSPDIIKPLVSTLNDNHFAVRASGIYSLGNKINQNPQLVDSIKPLLNDSHWQVRQAGVDTLGKLEIPDIDTLLVPKLKDPSAFVRQSTALNLGGRLQSHPNLIDPFIQTMKVDNDPFTRHITASALRGLPNDPHVIAETNYIQQALIPGVRIEGWTKEIAARPAMGVEIGYLPFFGSTYHTFISATYDGETRTLGFNAKNKFDPKSLVSTKGIYKPEFRDERKQEEYENDLIIYSTLSIDPIATKRLFDIIPTFYEKENPYNLWDTSFLGIMNCYGGRIPPLQAAGISIKINDMPWSPLGPSYKYSRSGSAFLGDSYFSYSSNFQQQVTVHPIGIRNIETNIWSNYQINPWTPTIPSWQSQNFKFQYTNPLNQQFLPPSQLFKIEPIYNIPRYDSFKTFDSSYHNYTLPSYNNYNYQQFNIPTYQPPPRIDTRY